MMVDIKTSNFFVNAIMRYVKIKVDIIKQEQALEQALEQEQTLEQALEKTDFKEKYKALITIQKLKLVKTKTNGCPKPASKVDKT